MLRNTEPPALMVAQAEMPTGNLPWRSPAGECAQSHHDHRTGVRGGESAAQPTGTRNLLRLASGQSHPNGRWGSMKEPVKITRKELFEQVWAEPVSRVAERYGLSGTWIRKVCLENDVPVPPSRLLGARG